MPPTEPTSTQILGEGIFEDGTRIPLNSQRDFIIDVVLDNQRVPVLRRYERIEGTMHVASYRITKTAPNQFQLTFLGRGRYDSLL